MLIMVIFRKLIGNKYFQAILRGLKPCIIGIIAATGFYMIFNNSIPMLFNETHDMRPMIITIILAALYFGLRKGLKKKTSPIMLIVFSAVLGVAVYGL